MIILTSFSVTSRDVAMATNFVKKMAHSHFSKSGIQNGLKDRNFDFRILNRMNFSTLYTILVTVGPVTPEIAR